MDHHCRPCPVCGICTICDPHLHIENAHRIVCRDGKMTFIYDDALRPLLVLGPSSTRRASHVEPAGGGWTADMAPSGGPVLGPFDTRGEALNAERAWLREHRGL